MEWTMQETYADLEIRIREKQDEGYPVEMRLNNVREFGPGYLDPGFLPWVPGASPGEDGQRLFDWLFSDDRLATAWAEVRGSHPQRRVRLRIDAAAPELHVLPWELLRDIGDGSASQDLAAATATPFSRYLAGRWQPGSPILKRPIRILVAVANPQNLGDFRLEAIDPEAEWALLQEAMEGLDAELVQLPHPCTLTALQEELQKGYHILHLVAHGAYRKQEEQQEEQAVVFLADEENQVKRVAEADFAAMLGHQLADTDVQNEDKLRLVFLASCQTATRSPADAFRGFAPALVAAGVPAVLAMQDRVPVDTAREFARSFYKHLLQHGQVDLAANQARAVLLAGELPGAAIPVLFMRQPRGRLLGQRGQILGDRAGSFWKTLLKNIDEEKCTPFLGPGMTAGLLPSPVEVARQLAEEYNYPFAATESLPRVAQFVATIDDRRLRQDILIALAEGFEQRMRLKPERDEHRGLSEIIEGADWSAGSRELVENEIHHQLAGLSLPLYLTTNFDNFMTLALRARLPEEERHRVRRVALAWRKEVRDEAGHEHFSLDPPPSKEEPVVMHLFGTDKVPRSMVLTEDDYLDYLSCISRDNQYVLPTDVNEALASTTLLFLGYRLEDLDLKVILRGLLTNLNQEGWSMLHVAVQIESSVVEDAKVEEVTSYLQRYFAKAEIDVYWGSVQQFVDDLYARWQEYTHG
jgi:hypothetical protein